MSPLGGKKNFTEIWHYIHQKMRIEKTKPGKKNILKNLHPSLRNGKKNWPKTVILPCMAFLTSFLAISQARLKIFENAFFPGLVFSIHIF